MRSKVKQTGEVSVMDKRTCKNIAKNTFPSCVADSNYRMRALDEKTLKNYLSKSKTITHELLQLVSKNDAKFNGR